MRVFDKSRLLRRLDRFPFHWTLLIGAGISLAMTVVVLWSPSSLAFVGVAIICVLAGALAWTARPVGVWDRMLEPGPSLLDMVPIEGGTFLMGSPEDEPDRFSNEQQRRVTLSPFEMSRTTVTESQYQEAMGLEEILKGKGKDRPATRVSWLDAIIFCNRLSKIEGATPCYLIDGSNVQWVNDAGGYRLPTEAEWEYASRAGAGDPWPFPRAHLDHYAWYLKNSSGRVHPVAILKPNPWGIHDLHGNIWEWCWDRYSEHPQRWWLLQFGKDPVGPGPATDQRILRGGCFTSEPRNLRSAYREANLPETSNAYIGFRCVRRRIV